MEVCKLQPEKPIPTCFVFVEKVVLEYSHTCSFTCICSCFHAVMAELGQRLWPTEPKIFTVWPFTRRYLLTSALAHQSSELCSLEKQKACSAFILLIGPSVLLYSFNFIIGEVQHRILRVGM